MEGAEGKSTGQKSSGVGIFTIQNHIMDIHITTHNFQKMNLITIVKGKRVFDEYECQDCKLKGRRYGLSEYITIGQNKKCVTKPKPNKVEIRSPALEQFGLIRGEKHDTVECPKDQAEKFGGDVWVFSPSRNEPVRLLTGEYININPAQATTTPVA